MALIGTLTHEPLNRPSIHDEVEATYSAFSTEGRRIVQVNTFGRPGRQHPGTQSQTLQFDAEAARALVDILKREFLLP